MDSHETIEISNVQMSNKEREDLERIRMESKEKNYGFNLLKGMGGYFRNVGCDYFSNWKQVGIFAVGSVAIGGALQTLNDALDFGLPHVVFTDKEASDTLKAVEALTDYLVSGAIPLISVYAIDPVLGWIKRLNPKTDKKEAVENVVDKLEGKLTELQTGLIEKINGINTELTTKISGIETKIGTVETNVMGKLNEGLNEESKKYLEDSKEHYEATSKAFEEFENKCKEMREALTKIDDYLPNIMNNIRVTSAEEKEGYTKLEKSVREMKENMDKVVAWTEAKDKKEKEKEERRAKKGGKE